MTKTISDKVIVISGGAGGLGSEIAKQFLNKQAKAVIILDIDENKGKSDVNELNKSFGDKSVFIKCDVTKDLDKVAEHIFKQFPIVDVLVNNAGVMIEKDIQKTVTINVTALMEFSYKFWEHMRKDKGGKGGTIINMSSIAGLQVVPYIPVYTATKFAVLGFTKSLGHAYNYNMTGVRVVTICPGVSKTNIMATITTREPELTMDDLNKFLTEIIYQEPDIFAVNLMDVIEKAESGSVWLIADNKAGVEIK